MSKRAVMWISVCLLAAPACGGSTTNTAPAPASGPEPASAEAVEAATRAADAWLKLVDEQQYEQSHHDAAEAFRNAVSSEAWSKAVSGVRGSVGKLVSRKLGSASYTTSLPGAADGKYVVIQYESSFENKASAVETVTPMQEPDGVWRVSGYFVK